MPPAKVKKACQKQTLMLEQRTRKESVEATMSGKVAPLPIAVHGATANRKKASAPLSLSLCAPLLFVF